MIDREFERYVERRELIIKLLSIRKNTPHEKVDNNTDGDKREHTDK